MSLTLITAQMSIGSISSVLAGTQLKTQGYYHSLMGAITFAVIVGALIHEVSSAAWCIQRYNRLTGSTEILCTCGGWNHCQCLWFPS